MDYRLLSSNFCVERLSVSKSEIFFADFHYFDVNWFKRMGFICS